MMRWYQFDTGQVPLNPLAALRENLRLRSEAFDVCVLTVGQQAVRDFDERFGADADLVLNEGIERIGDAADDGVLVWHQSIVG